MECNDERRNDVPMGKRGFDIDTAFRTLELTNAWVNNADTKVSFALAFSSAVLGLIFYNAGSKPKALVDFELAYSTNTISAFNWCSIALLVVMYSCFVLVLGCFFLALKGRITNNSKRKSMLFFGSIASQSLNDYKSRFFSIDSMDLEKDIAEQIYINSEICNYKFKWYNRGLLLLLIATLLLVVSLVIHVL